MYWEIKVGSLFLKNKINVASDIGFLPSETTYSRGDSIMERAHSEWHRCGH